MRVKIRPELGDLAEGVRAVAPDLGLEITDDGVAIHAVQWEKDELSVVRQGSQAEICFGSRAQFFRGLGLLKELSGSGEDFTVSEDAAFQSLGAMIDISQGNAVPRVSFVKYLMRRMALMGMNVLMLYSEDSYEIPELPFFGYMRGRLTQDDLRAIDDYAYMLGIELIPCIQVLGHLYDVLKWKPFRDLQDDPYTLLAGDEESYDLIEKMIVAASSPVRSDRINIGMDEAWNLGLGQYLVRHGYRPKLEIMADHLSRVVQIVERNGLRPMMWSDMFFRSTSPSNSYDSGNLAPEVEKSAVPEDVELIYWSYHNPNQAFYQEWLERHVELGSGRLPVFAGGISNWRGWAPNYGMSIAATRAALEACKKVGVKEVIATLWGDDGTECDLTSCLLGLQFYAESCYGGDISDERLSRRFQTCCQGNSADFMLLREIDEAPGVEQENPDSKNPSEYLLWQNTLMGLFDANVRSLPLARHYEELGDRIEGAIARNPAHEEMFWLYRKLCSALAVKAELGIQLTDAYQAGDRAQLRKLTEERVPQAIRAIRELHEHHRQRWHSLYQAFGWEVMDARYGTVLLGLEAAQWRLEQYLNEAVGSLEELEEQRLPFDGEQGQLSCQYVGKMQSASRLYWDAG